MTSIKIKSSGTITKIYLNDEEIKGVSKYELSQQAGYVPKLILTIPAHEIDIETPCIPELPDIYKSFYERKELRHGKTNNRN